MKLRYIGESFIVGLTDGKTYDCLAIEDGGDFGSMLRIIDDDEDNWNYDDSPDWKPGYLYSPINPAPLDMSSPGGRWEIVEDDENGSLSKIIK
ncbi:MAG: hypothetical protein ACOYI4_06415 [Christensenellales bacterium]